MRAVDHVHHHDVGAPVVRREARHRLAVDEKERPLATGETVQPRAVELAYPVPRRCRRPHVVARDHHAAHLARRARDIASIARRERAVGAQVVDLKDRAGFVGPDATSEDAGRPLLRGG